MCGEGMNVIAGAHEALVGVWSRALGDRPPILTDDIGNLSRGALAY